jgi:drug/metabolite transporter (DMT)-like permease
MTSSEFESARESFGIAVLPLVFSFLFGFGFVAGAVRTDHPFPATARICFALLAIVAGAICFYSARKAYRVLRGMECPACKELLSSNYDLVSRTGRCPVCGERILSDVYDESFQPARTQSPQPHGDSAGNMRRRKVLACFLMLLGMAGMAYGIPFNGDFNPQKGTAMFAGAVLAVIGIFIRSRLRQQIPVLAITEMDKADFKKMRQTFAIRNLLARFIGTFGAVMLFAGICSPFYDHSGKSFWAGVIILLLFGGLLVYCSNLLYQKPK